MISLFVGLHLLQEAFHSPVIATFPLVALTGSEVWPHKGTQRQLESKCKRCLKAICKGTQSLRACETAKWTSLMGSLILNVLQMHL